MLRAAAILLCLGGTPPAAAQTASAAVTAAALEVLPEGVRPEDICRTGAGAPPHLGQLWSAGALARLDLRDRRAAGLRGLLSSAAPSPDPDAPDYMVMEIAAPGLLDGEEIWLRLRPSDRLRDGGSADVWLHYATDNVVEPEIRRLLAEAPPPS